MEKYKVEIIDNQIGNYYQINLFKWGKINKWYQSEKFDWCFVSREILGKNYMCPEIHTKKITIEEFFERNVKEELKRDGIEEVHRIIVEKNK